MTEIIDYFAIKDLFWIQFKGHLVSFGFKGLPNHIHLTIGFDERSADINFHVSKNMPNVKEKPQIKIFVINKELLKDDIPFLSISILKKYLKPLDLEEIKSKYGEDLYFISYNDSEDSDLSMLVKNNFTDNFKDILKNKRKTRWKIDTNIDDIGDRIKSFAISTEMQNFFLNNIIDLPIEFQKPVEVGMIVAEDEAFQVIRINDEWFTIRTDIKPMDLLTSFINPELAMQMIWKTKRALVCIKNAKSYSDIKNLNNPIRLERQETKNECNIN